MRRGLVVAVWAALLGCKVQTRLTPPVAPPAKSTAAPCPTQAIGEELVAAGDGYVGRTIARVCLLGASLETRATSERSLQVLAGQVVDARRVREDLAILYGLGRYDDVAAFGMETAQGLVLLYRVRERPQIAAFVLTGAEGFVDVAWLRPFAIHGFLDIRELHELRRGLLSRCEAAGHLQCQVDHRLTPVADANGAGNDESRDSGGQVRVEVTVVPGPVSRVGAVTFRGANKVPRGELLGASALRVGGRLGRLRVDEAVAGVLGKMHEGGRLGAKVTVVEGARAADGTVALGFEIVEGAVYTFSGLHVTGSAAAEEAKLLAEVVTLRVGKPYARSAVAEDVDRIKVYFEAKGEPVYVTPRSVRDSAKATIDLSFEVSRSLAQPR